jgi:hypothetical protein
MKLIFPKQNYNVQSPSSYTHISVRDLYISRIGLPILLQGNMWTNPGNILVTYRHINVEIGTEAALFPEKEYISGIFPAVWGWGRTCLTYEHRGLFCCFPAENLMPLQVIPTPFQAIF